MPETYEDSLPYVVPMNRDYDEGRMDGECNPLPDCTPGVYTLPNAYSDDELVSATVSLPWSSNALWTMFIPDELRVWRLDPVLGWVLVENNPLLSVSVAVSGQTFQLKIEGLSPSGTSDNYLTVSCQKTDASYNPLGLPIEDRVKVEVVSIDLEIAEISELDEETRAASVLVNDDYEEGNFIVYVPERVVYVSDTGKVHGHPVSLSPRIVVNDDDLTDASLTIDGPNGQIGKYWIEVVGEPSYAQHVLVWKADGTPVPRTRESALPITLDAQAVDLLIEGLAKYDNESNPMRLVAHFEPDGDYAKAGVEADVVDEVMALVGVNGWWRDEPWAGQRGDYTGWAIAGSDYDTLEQLAKNITGHAADADLLRWDNPFIEPIEEYTNADISILLEALEVRLRENVVEAANADKAAKFGSGLDFGPGGGSTEAFVNRIFGIGRPATKQPTFDCLNIIGVVMARGVIMELMPGEFDAMGFGFAHFMVDEWSHVGQYFNQYDPVIAQGDLDEGDWAVFYNKKDYKKRNVGCGERH